MCLVIPVAAQGEGPMCLVLPVVAGGEGAAEVGVASFSVSVTAVTPRRERGVQRGEAAEREQRRRRHHFLFLERWDLLGADWRRATAALPPGVVGAGAVSVVRSLSLRQLVDGRQLVMKRVVILVVLVLIIQTYKKNFVVFYF